LRVVLGRVLTAKYRLDAEIGAGAMGRVYRARQLDLERDVAVKVLHPLMAQDEGAQLRFAREAKVAARLNHPAAVSVLDFGIDHDLPFLVMELMEGETLRQRLAAGPMLRADALAVAMDVADALIAAHQIRLIHRDIKPENTFLQRTAWGERVRVVDFGLAFLATGELALGRMTQDGYVGGTPAYMSPEQVHGRGVGPAADIYSLGCMLYELIAGHPPFRGSLAELLTSQAYAPPRPLRLLELRPPVPPELDRLVLSMLSKSAPLRPSPSAVWQALRDLAQDVPSRATAPTYVSERSARALQPRSGGERVPTGEDPTATPAAIAVGSQHPPDEAGVATVTIASGVHRLPSVRVVTLGEISEELEFGLVSAGCAVERDGELDQAEVIWAPGVSDARLRELTAHAPVVTDLGAAASPAAEAGQGAAFEALMQRLRAGAADVILEVLTPDQLARKLLRVARRPHAAARGANAPDPASDPASASASSTASAAAA
jgi:serine/threonine protein kinase